MNSNASMSCYNCTTMNFHCCIPQNNSEGEVSKVNRISIAEIAFVIATIALIALTIASHYTNFTQPHTLVSKVTLTKATVSLLVATCVSGLIAIALEGARRRADAALNKGPFPGSGQVKTANRMGGSAAYNVEELVQGIRALHLDRVRNALSRVNDGTQDLIINQNTGETAFHVLARILPGSVTPPLMDGEIPYSDPYGNIVDHLAKKAAPGVIDAQLKDSGDTAMHIALRNNNNKLYAALLARAANHHILNNQNKKPGE